MTAMETDLQYRRLRVPRDHGGVLIDPPLASALPLLENNVALREDHQSCDIQGQSLHGLSEEARRLLLAAASQYTSEYRDVPAEVSPGEPSTIFLAGHQPQLSHPGVWFKNFVIDGLAQQSRSAAVQLLIDNDVMRTAAIRVPGGCVDDPIAASVLLDRPAAVLPYEQRQIGDIDLFASFAQRVQQTMRSLVSEPLVQSIWPWAIEAARARRNLGQCLSQARHRLEQTWGLATLELPLSHICDTVPFRRFMLHLLDRLPVFRPLYNEALHEYRNVHRIRSHSHPVADLLACDNWQEAPFWLWTDADPRRRPVFVESIGGLLRLRAGRPTPTDRGGQGPDPGDLEVTVDCRAERGIDQLDQLRIAGVKLRPRALMTTMYARLALGDVFVHGIGGSKYDQLTDLLIQRFLRITPPGFMTVSATFLLPTERPNVSAADVRHVDWLLRDLWYHPERYLNGQPRALDPEATQLVSEKRRWVEMRPARGNGRTRRGEIEQLNQKLRRLVEDQREQLLRERERLRGLLRCESILASRQYAFCLFPEEQLRGPLCRLAKTRESR